MIKVEQDQINHTVEIKLAPNCSMTPSQIALFLAVSGLVVIGIGGIFLGLGLWLVLPFSGLEWFVLCWAFWRVNERRSQWERLVIDDAVIRYESSQGSLVRGITFQRAWVQLRWNKALYRGHSGRLSLGSHGKQIFIGEFLAESERQTLFDQLREILDK